MAGGLLCVSDSVDRGLGGRCSGRGWAGDELGNAGAGTARCVGRSGFELVNRAGRKAD
jgi:hypothetical protein